MNFAGWLKGDTKYDFDTPVTGNITLKAKWSEDPVYTVTLMDGTTKAKEVQVTKDDEYKVTLTATKVGYTLKAITSDKEGKTAVTFPLTVSDDTTLYAQFEINKYKVTFDVDGGSAVEAQTVEYGKKATKPADPTKEGFTFKGWDFDFDKPVEKDVTVKAIWEEAVVTLAENWAYGETYEGPVTYSFVQNGDWGSQADPDNVPVYKLDLSSIATLKAKDMITLTFKINTSADLNQIGIVSNLNGWGWNALPAKAAGETYSIMLTVGDNFTGTEAQIKFVPQSSSKDLIGTDVTVTFTELTTSYEEFVAGAEQETTIAEAVGSYAKFAGRTDLQGYLDAADGDVKLIFNCVLAIEEDNNYDYVGQIAGWDASWTNSTDDFGDFTFKLDGKVPESNNKGSEFEVEFDVATLLDKCSKTDLFCVNIWQDKFTISSVVVKYKAK